MAAQEKVKVFFSSFVFAKILNTAAKSGRLEDGILCGERNFHIFNNITDSQEQDEKRQEITIQNTISANSSFSFYDKFGIVDEEKLNVRFTRRSDSGKRLVGWYRIRRNTSLYISLRERAVIKSLLDGNILKSDNLLFVVVAPSCDEHRSTHIYSYRCYYCKKGKTPVPIKANILNLGEEPICQNKYKRRSRLIEEGGNSSFADVLHDKEGSKFFNEDTGSAILADNTYSIFKKTCNVMKNLQHQLTESYHNIEEYREEVKKLETKHR